MMIWSRRLLERNRCSFCMVCLIYCREQLMNTAHCFTLESDCTHRLQQILLGNPIFTQRKFTKIAAKWIQNVIGFQNVV